MRKSTAKEYEVLDILKLDIMTESPWWDPSSPEFCQMEQSMLNERESLPFQQSSKVKLLIINFVTSFAYDTTDVVDNEKVTISWSCQWELHK